MSDALLISQYTLREILYVQSRKAEGTLHGNRVGACLLIGRGSGLLNAFAALCRVFSRTGLAIEPISSARARDHTTRVSLPGARRAAHTFSRPRGLPHYRCHGVVGSRIRYFYARPRNGSLRRIMQVW